MCLSSDGRELGVGVGVGVGAGGGGGVLEDPRNAYLVILIQELGGQSVSECKKTAGGEAYFAH